MPSQMPVIVIVDSNHYFYFLPEQYAAVHKDPHVSELPSVDWLFNRFPMNLVTSRYPLLDQQGFNELYAVRKNDRRNPVALENGCLISEDFFREIESDARKIQWFESGAQALTHSKYGRIGGEWRMKKLIARTQNMKLHEVRRQLERQRDPEFDLSDLAYTYAVTTLRVDGSAQQTLKVDSEYYYVINDKQVRVTAETSALKVRNRQLAPLAPH